MSIIDGIEWDEIREALIAYYRDRKEFFALPQGSMKDRVPPDLWGKLGNNEWRLHDFGKKLSGDL